MTGNPDDDIRALLCGIACHAGEHLGRARADLTQLDALLSEAIGKLCDSFIVIHAASQKQQALLATHIGAEQADAISMEMGAALNSAMTGLQFQDMSAQLIAGIACRITGVQKIVDIAASRHCDPGNPETGPSALIASRISAMACQSDELTRGTPQSVHQQHMESGEIELF